MESYRAQLAKIGVPTGSSQSYRAFFLQPTSLSQALAFMDHPSAYQQLTEKSIQEGWTEQAQGVAWDGTRWLFSSNGSQPVSSTIGPVGSSPKAIYTFTPSTDFSDSEIASTFVIATVEPGNASTNWQMQIPCPIGQGYGYHVGTLFCFEGKVYVDHFTSYGQSATLVLNNANGALSFDRWIVLEPVNGQRVGLVAVDTFGSSFLTAFGDGVIGQIFQHDMSGQFIRDRSLQLGPPISDGRWIQGGAVTPRGHLYLASGKADTGKFQNIYCYSLLNGHLLLIIPVLSEDSKQELEGMCFAPMVRNGQRVQLHAVLLDEHLTSHDGIFFKSFGSPDAALA